MTTAQKHSLISQSHHFIFTTMDTSTNISMVNATAIALIVGLSLWWLTRGCQLWFHSPESPSLVEAFFRREVISRASERLALAYIGPEYRELMAIRKMSNDITASELDREGNFLSDQAERLRRVLEYILRMDYGMEPFADCLNLCDYRIIAGHINDMQLRHALNLDWVPWCEKIKITVVDPAIELGLPAYVALRMLNRFAVNHTDDQKYGGCHDYIRQRWGPSCLGRKVDTDLHVTIAAIVPWCKEKTRSELWKRADALLDELSLSDDETQSKAGEADEASVAEEQERRTADDVCTTCPSEVSPPPDFYDKRGVLRGLWTGVKALFTAPGPRPKRRGLTRMEVEERGGMVLALDPRITSHYGIENHEDVTNLREYLTIAGHV
ncbi:hypothetical protein B0A50_08508 [Salinomyces thailandicus]|uniref:Uncharacterized protein n=1 Tax=Salinomyces thailandicus TaxID=706561 RepID=A0A4V5N311_9PEZI|nr:hypothetical protein B0A50_08508 [Salinomyces thailandica]